MVTLSKRASPQQHRVLRIVEGAVKNAADAHPELNFTPQIARSIAKRAAGTLTAQWPDVLAATKPTPSVSADVETRASVGTPAPQRSRGSGKGARKPVGPRTHLRFLWKRFSIETGYAKHRGQLERAQAFIDMLKIIDALRLRSEKPE